MLFASISTQRNVRVEPAVVIATSAATAGAEVHTQPRPARIVDLPKAPRLVLGGGNEELPTTWLFRAAWDATLQHDIDREFLLEGFSEGFRVVPDGVAIKPARVSNYRSCYTDSAMPRIDEQVRHELLTGRFIRVDPSLPIRVHAMAAIPKKNSNKLRIIDCSKPTSDCINNHIPAPPFKYVSVDSAMKLMRRRCWMTVLDISEAFRQVPIHPSQHRLFGLTWRGQYYLDTRLCFGLRNAPYLFDRIGQAIIRAIRHSGYHAQIYVDDIFICERTKQRCQEATTFVINLLQKLHFNVNEKIQICKQVVQYLGVELDSRRMVARLSTNKLSDLKADIDHTLTLRKVTKRGLQSLAGKLGWACKVVYGGRTFLRRLLDIMNALKKPHHLTRISKALRADLEWWQAFLPTFNGQSDILDSKPIDGSQLETDAAAHAGYGAYYAGDWISHWWPPDLQGMHINFLEVYPLLAAARRWGKRWTGRRVILRCDNLAAVGIINRGTTRHPVVMSWLRELFWLSATHNFRISAIHVPGVFNTRADALSRFDFTRFWAALTDQFPSVRPQDGNP